MPIFLLHRPRFFPKEHTMSSLAYINARATSAVDARIPLTDEENALIEQTETPIVSVAGFPVVDTQWHDREREKRIRENGSRLALYRKDVQDVTAELAARDIVPLAVLPSSAWKRICDNAGIYRLFVNERGEVGIHDFWSSAGDRQRFEAGWSLVCLLTFVASFSAMIAVARLVTPSSHREDLALLALPMLLISAALGTGAATAYVSRSICRFVNRASHKELLALCFPAYTDGTHPGLQKIALTRARIALPEPPPEVTALLARARGLELFTAAEPDAIRFVESPTDLLNRLRKEHEERLRADPIIYLQHGSAVAIIAQFGDFPIEQRVVDEVLGASYLP